MSLLTMQHPYSVVLMKFKADFITVSVSMKLFKTHSILIFLKAIIATGLNMY